MPKYWWFGGKIKLSKADLAVKLFRRQAIKGANHPEELVRKDAIEAEEGDLGTRFATLDGMLQEWRHPFRWIVGDTSQAQNLVLTDPAK